MGQKRAKIGLPENHISGQSNRPLSKPAHSLHFNVLHQELDTDISSGLSSQDANHRLDEFGANELGQAEGVQPLRIVVAQIANAMTLVRCSMLLLLRKRD